MSPFACLWSHGDRCLQAAPPAALAALPPGERSLLRLSRSAYEERFAAAYGDWRPVVREVADKFLACGVLKHGFAQVRSDACAHQCFRHDGTRKGDSTEAISSF